MSAAISLDSSSQSTPEEAYQLERRAIFSRRWLLMTHKKRFRGPGDWVQYETAGYRFVIAQDRKGNINGFHNICRHRAYSVVEGQHGTNRIFACRYHGWSYGLDGRLAKAPGYQDLPDFDKTQNNLFRIHVHVDTLGFIWVNLAAGQTPEASPDEEQLNDSRQERRTALNLVDYNYDQSREVEFEENWKLAAQSCGEGPREQTTHPEMAECIDYYWPDASVHSSQGLVVIQRVIPRGPRKFLLAFQVFRHKDATDRADQVLDVMSASVQESVRKSALVSKESRRTDSSNFWRLLHESLTKHNEREQTAKAEIWPAQQALPPNAAAALDDLLFCRGLESCHKLPPDAIAF